MKYIFAAIILTLIGSDAMAWRGINLDTGTMIEVKTYGADSVQHGNIEYFDYELGEIKFGFINMYEQNIGLIIDLESGELLRVQMNAVESDENKVEK